MKLLTLEETKLKEEMKERCLAKGQYKDENAKAKFNMLCHLEDFEIQYWELLQENKQLKEELECTIGIVEHNRIISEKNKEIHQLKEEYNKIQKAYESTFSDYQQLKDNWNYIKKMLKEVRQEKFNINGYCGTCTDVDIDFLLNKMQELEQGSDSK